MSVASTAGEMKSMLSAWSRTTACVAGGCNFQCADKAVELAMGLHGVPLHSISLALVRRSGREVRDNALSVLTAPVIVGPARLAHYSELG